jgi:hypothetical protein
MHGITKQRMIHPHLKTQNPIKIMLVPNSEDNNDEASGKTDGGKSSHPKQQQTPSSNKNNIKQPFTPNKNSAGPPPQ